MCNLYSITTNQEAIRNLFSGIRDVTGNLPPMPGVYPNYEAPIIRKPYDVTQVIAALADLTAKD